ncbi:YjzC family protein [Nannocystis bainbridge]|uniref:YjzC family protein n=1 Tax=Nannocystis bainbridge TaxID=2995303 RepID=A0ABT5E801_9BACT|nr:YjzC family protein [Nannocystis bainbridge]MDC0721987.1 YjzC family protein [Nannocystis bainbridge]
MANVGDRFKTSDKCKASGEYVFDGYTDGPTGKQPTQEEREISLETGEEFPPIRSTGRGAYWKLLRLQ